jgi:hypothetical protein
MKTTVRHNAVAHGTPRRAHIDRSAKKNNFQQRRPDAKVSTRSNACGSAPQAIAAGPPIADRRSSGRSVHQADRTDSTNSATIRCRFGAHRIGG